MLQTERDVEELVLGFYRSPEKYPGQRLGQTLINNCPLNIVDSEIFYCEDPDKAFKLFLKRYTAASGIVLGQGDVLPETYPGEG